MSALAVATPGTVSMLVLVQVHVGLAEDAWRRASRYEGELKTYWEQQADDHFFDALAAVTSL